MTQSQQKLRRRDEIDDMVDDLVADPSRAEEIRIRLHKRLRVVEPEPPRDELEDLWENVPV